MGKGFNKAGNKQADLARKLALAKQQTNKEEPASPIESEGSIASLSEAEIKKRNDKLRFEELLKRESASVLNDYSKDGYLTKDQEEEEVQAARSGVDRLFEGDQAPSEPFEELVSVESGNAVGKAGVSRLVPWLRKNGQDDYLIILTDPRRKSPEMRESIQHLTTELPLGVLSKLIVVNVDSPAENRRWMKKNGVENVEVYSDEKLQWMRAYTALGEKRYFMCMFIVRNERVEKLAREVDGSMAARVIQNAIKSL